jgi:hypothetical protein
MTTTTHTAIGAVIGTLVGTPILGFVVGVISHYLVDTIPHGDMHMREANHLVNKTNERRAHVFVVADIALAITLVVVLGSILPNNITQSSLYAASIFGSILPDVLVGLNDLVKSPAGRRHTHFHFIFHDFFCRKFGDPKLAHALAIQGIFVVSVIFFLSR